jgi:tetratricopeptide (TPR) repeat protein
MASSKPIVRQIAWVSLFPQLIFMAAIILALSALKVSNPIIVGAAIYLVLSFALRFLIAVSHRKGMVAFRNGDYASALPHFEASYNFFEKHKWLDKWRYLVLLSSSKISYKEMAMLNIAFCYSQLDKGAESKKAYEDTFSSFPNSEMAKAALNMIASVSNSTEL